MEDKNKQTSVIKYGEEKIEVIDGWKKTIYTIHTTPSGAKTVIKREGGILTI